MILILTYISLFIFAMLHINNINPIACIFYCFSYSYYITIYGIVSRILNFFVFS